MKLSSSYYATTSMLPPPPPPVMARPVAIIRSTDMTNSPPPTVTPPPLGADGSSAANRSPLSPSSSIGHGAEILHARSGPSGGGGGGGPNGPSATGPGGAPSSSSSSFGRDYTFSHLHAQSGQLFTYTNIGPVGGMSGVISPTNLSLFSSSPSSHGSASGNGSGDAGPGSANSPRTITANQHAVRSVPRWNTGSFMTLDDNMDYSMMSPLIAAGSQDQQGPPLMDDERYFNPVVHTSEALEASHMQQRSSAGQQSSAGPGTPTKTQPPPQQQPS